MPQAKKNHKSTEAQQHAKFKEAARELGCDEDDAAFDEKLKKVAAHKQAETSTESPAPTLARKPRRR